MSEIILINDIFDDLKSENNRLLSELLYAQKNIEFLENYQKLCTDFNKNCICHQNSDNKNYFQFLDNNNKYLNNEFKDSYSNSPKKVGKNTLKNEASVKLNNRGFDKQFENIKIKTEFSTELSDEIIQQPIPVEESISSICNNSTDLFICQYSGCMSTFSRYSSYKSHELIHKKENSILCPLIGCDKRFANNEDLKLHVSEHTGMSVSVKQIKRKKRQFSIKELVDEISCGKLKTQILPEQNIKAFQREKVKGKGLRSVGYGCNYKGCKFMSTVKVHVVSHINKSHQKLKLINCKLCNYKTAYEVSIKNHIKFSHANSITVTKTNTPSKAVIKSFTPSKTVIKSNKPSKTVIKSNTHSKTVNKSNNPSKTVINTNSPTKSMYCKFKNCKFMCKSETLLKIHREKHQTSGARKVGRPKSVKNSNKQAFDCDWPGCQSRFMFKFQLEKHLKTHKSEELLVCQQSGCGQKFMDNFSFIEHQNTHKDNNRFVCSECGIYLKSLGDIAAHMLNHYKTVQ